MFLLLLDVNECLSEPCKHGGTCEDQPGSYLCHCPQGFKGPNCEAGIVFTQPVTFFKLNSISTSCRTTITIYYKHVCAEQDACDSNPCLNGGVCRGYRRHYLCVCKDGFFGDQCQMCKWHETASQVCSVNVINQSTQTLGSAHSCAWAISEQLYIFVAPQWRTRVCCSFVETVASARPTGEETTTVFAKQDTQAKTVRKVSYESHHTASVPTSNTLLLCSSSDVFKGWLYGLYMWGFHCSQTCCLPLVSTCCVWRRTKWSCAGMSRSPLKA